MFSLLTVATELLLASAEYTTSPEYDLNDAIESSVVIDCWKKKWGGYGGGYSIIGQGGQDGGNGMDGGNGNQGGFTSYFTQTLGDQTTLYTTVPGGIVTVYLPTPGVPQATGTAYTFTTIYTVGGGAPTPITTTYTSTLM